MLLCLFSGELMTEILKTAMKVFLPIVLLMQSNILACFIGAPDPVTVDAARGYQALITRSFVPGQFPRVHIDEAWKTWGLPAKPANYAAAFRERYGLSEAPYPNHGLPMGLKTSRMPLGAQGASLDCLTCHGGSLLGKPMPGLGNTALDLQAIFEELSSRGTRRIPTPYQFCNTRGTNEAGATAVYLGGFRKPDLGLRLSWLNLGLHDTLCEDVPAWWLLRRKTSMYATGEADARSVRSVMQFMMHPFNLPGAFEREESTFQDIQKWILTLRAPPWPWGLDSEKSDRGRIIHHRHCARCHGTATEYPNRIIPLNVVGTDATRFHGIEPAFGIFYNQSWFAQEKNGWFTDGMKSRRTDGYQAPPLDGIWATAPYLHNGSVPTLGNLLDSKTRPVVFTRSFLTLEQDFDRRNIGWKTFPPPGNPPASPMESRRIYDTRMPGRGNGGHLFGDSLTPEEREDLIEFLKTL